MGTNARLIFAQIQVSNPGFITGNTWPRVDYATFNLTWNGRNVTPYKVPKLGVNLVWMPTGKMQDAHGCKMRTNHHTLNS